MKLNKLLLSTVLLMSTVPSGAYSEQIFMLCKTHNVDGIPTNEIQTFHAEIDIEKKTFKWNDTNAAKLEIKDGVIFAFLECEPKTVAGVTGCLRDSVILDRYTGEFNFLRMKHGSPEGLCRITDKAKKVF